MCTLTQVQSIRCTTYMYTVFIPVAVGRGWSSQQPRPAAEQTGRSWAGPHLRELSHTPSGAERLELAADDDSHPLQMLREHACFTSK